MWEQTGKFISKTLEPKGTLPGIYRGFYGYSILMRWLLGEDMSWWSEDGAWPGVIDQFVEYVREKRSQDKMEE